MFSHDMDDDIMCDIAANFITLFKHICVELRGACVSLGSVEHNGRLGELIRLHEDVRRWEVELLSKGT